MFEECCLLRERRKKGRIQCAEGKSFHQDPLLQRSSCLCRCQKVQKANPFKYTNLSKIYLKVWTLVSLGLMGVMGEYRHLLC